MAIVYNVQIHPIHPIHAGHVNDHKVISEHEFDNFDEAKAFMEQFNEFRGTFRPWLEIAEWPFAIDTDTGENL
jgi:hypothetical protein